MTESSMLLTKKPRVHFTKELIKMNGLNSQEIMRQEKQVL